MNGSSWWDAVHGATGGGWLDVGGGSAITPASVTAGMHHPHHPHHQMSNYNDYSSLTHTLAASNPHLLTSGQHLLQVRPPQISPLTSDSITYDNQRLPNNKQATAIFRMIELLSVIIMVCVPSVPIHIVLALCFMITL